MGKKEKHRKQVGQTRNVGSIMGGTREPRETDVFVSRFPQRDISDDSLEGLIRRGGFVIRPLTPRQELRIRADLAKKKRRSKGDVTEEEAMHECMRHSIVAILEPDGDETEGKPNPRHSKKELEKLEDDPELTEDQKDKIRDEYFEKFPEMITIRVLAERKVSIGDGSVDEWLNHLTQAEYRLLIQTYGEIFNPLSYDEIEDFMSGRVRRNVLL